MNEQSVCSTSYYHGNSYDSNIQGDRLHSWQYLSTVILMTSVLSTVDYMYYSITVHSSPLSGHRIEHPAQAPL